MSVILLIGSGGQLGKEINSLIPDAIVTDHNPGGEHYLSIDDFSSLERILMKVSPDIVINAAAFTGVDLCETERERAYSVNAESLRVLAEVSREMGSFLVHFSTDYVFNGREGRYTEASIPDPVNFYGLSKLIGDAYALAYPDSLVIRTSGVFGGLKNFPGFVLEKLRKKQGVSALKGYYSPIHASLLAKAALKLTNLRMKGLFNIAGDRISRSDLAVRIANEFDLDGTLVSEADFLPGLIASRPFDSSLDVSGAVKVLDFDFHTTDASIKAFRSSLDRGK